MKARAGSLAPYVAVAALAAVFLADPPFTGRVPFYRDLGLAVHPVLAEARRGHDGAVDALPFWSNHLSNGRPLIGNPGNVLLHPGNVLYLVLPFDRAYTLFICGHVAIAGLLMTALARRLGASRTGSFAAGAAFALGGFTVSAANLYPWLAAGAWAPLTVAAGLGVAQRPALRRLALLAGSLALQALGGQPEPLVLTAALTVLLSLAMSSRSGLGRALVGTAWTWSLAGAVALSLAAPQVLPAIANARGSLRGLGFTAAGLLYNSVHPRRLAWLVVPGAGGDPMAYLEGGFPGARLTDTGTPYFVTLYLGVVVVALAWIGMTTRSRDDKAASSSPRPLRVALAVAALAAATLSLGRFLPGAEALAEHVPWVVPFRYPEKLLFVTFLAVPPLAALGLDAVASRTRVRGVGVVLAALVAADLARVHHGLVPTIELDALRPPPLAESLLAESRRMGLDDSQWRIHHQRPAWIARLPAGRRSEEHFYRWKCAALFPSTAARAGLRTAFEPTGDLLDGIAYFSLARDIHAAAPREWAQGLGRVGVLWVVSSRDDLEAATAGVLRLVRSLDRETGATAFGGVLYRNTAFVPRARLVGDGGSTAGEARIVDETHRSLIVEVVGEREATLALSDTLAPGWSAVVDGAPAAIATWQGAFRAVAVPAGRHLVRFDYVPPGLRLGCALAVLGLVVVAAALAWERVLDFVRR
jgi:hypothetical protein